MQHKRAQAERHSVEISCSWCLEATDAQALPVLQDMPKPRARSNAMLAVSGDTLWLFGGIVEVTFEP
jgi:hypothetical protein